MAHYKEMTASGVAVGYPCTLKGLQVNGDTAAASVILYNNASAASGDKVITVKVATDEDSKFCWFGEAGVPCSAGIYLDETGADNCTVYYD